MGLWSYVTLQGPVVGWTPEVSHRGRLPVCAVLLTSRGNLG